MSYYYLDVSLDLASDCEISSVFFKKHVTESINTLFGEVGAAITFDVLKYNLVERRAILRVPKDHYIKLRSSLTLSGSYQGVNSTYTIYKASSLLLALSGDSRSYEH